MAEGFKLSMNIYCYNTYYSMPIKLEGFYSSRLCGTGRLLIGLRVIMLNVYNESYCKLCNAVNSLKHTLQTLGNVTLPLWTLN
jgi:hypothetical protein